MRERDLAFTRDAFLPTLLEYGLFTHIRGFRELLLFYDRGHSRYGRPEGGMFSQHAKRGYNGRICLTDLASALKIPDRFEPHGRIAGGDKRELRGNRHRPPGAIVGGRLFEHDERNGAGPWNGEFPP